MSESRNPNVTRVVSERFMFINISCKGIYALFNKNGEIIYIGMSNKNIYSRSLSHKNRFKNLPDSQKPVRVFCKEINLRKDYISAIESSLIGLYKPIHNKTSLCGSRFHELGITEKTSIEHAVDFFENFYSDKDFSNECYINKMTNRILGELRRRSNFDTFSDIENFITGIAYILVYREEDIFNKFGEDFVDQYYMEYLIEEYILQKVFISGSYCKVSDEDYICYHPHTLRNIKRVCDIEHRNFKFEVIEILKSMG